MSGTRVQSPEIGTALRTALSLDAAGGMPLEFDQVVVPVAVVADVRELLTQKYVAVNQAGLQAPVAAEYSYSALAWDSGTLPIAKRIILDSLTLTATVATNVFFGFNAGGWPGAVFGLPRRKTGSLQSSYVTGKVVSSSSLNPPDVAISSVCGGFNLQASQVFRIQFNEPIILDAESQAFVIGTSVVNNTLRSYWEWREERA